MSLIISLISSSSYFDASHDLLGWVAWFTLLVLVIILNWRWRRYNTIKNNTQWLWFGILLFLIPATTLFVGIRLPVGDALPYPGFPNVPQGPALMIFIALPWMLAAGVLGTTPAALLAAISGILFGYWETHSVFTPLEFALIAVLFSAAVNQPYRTITFRILRRPIIAGVVAATFYPVIYFLTNLLTVGDTLSVGLDFTLSRVGWISFGLAGEFVIAGAFVEVIAIGWPKIWHGDESVTPSPAESSLETRFFYIMGPIVVILFALLMMAVWLVAGDTAEKSIQNRMSSAAEMAANSLPYMLETGQNLIKQIAADGRLLSASPEEIHQILDDSLSSIPYFSQLFLLDEIGQPVSGYPVIEFQSIFPTQEERIGIEIARQGVTFQMYSVPPTQGGNAAQLSFIVTVRDDFDQTRGVLLGRSDLSSNPFVQPIIDSLEHMKTFNGEGMLIDDNGLIMYHTIPNLVATKYIGEIEEQATFNDVTGPAGTRQLIYYQPIVGRSWAVVTTIPAQQIQQQALDIAIPLLGLLIILALIAYTLLRIGLRAVTGSLQALAAESNRIASGELDHPLPEQGIDEVGQLGTAFEEMRVSLKARLEEINRLLFVSQGVASTLELKDAVKPILEASLTTGAASSRLVLASAALPDYEENTLTSFSLGSAADLYSSLDSQVLELTQQQDMVVLSNPARAGLTFDDNAPPPASLVATALRHEQANYGTLWLAFIEPHNVSEDEMRFITTLANQASLATANARLYQTAQIGRQRLEAILASTPDPVLVTDHRGHLLLANPAAIDLINDGKQPTTGTPIEEVIHKVELLDLLLASEDEPQSVEISFPENRVFYASASPVFAEGQQMGRVCVMRDITHFKELDTLKSDFVNTVSHDLRSPLTLMRGYASMLQMVGDLNEQQKSYLRKIVNGVESMTDLVHSLLDLGRIEAGIDLRLEMIPVVDVIHQVTDDLQARSDQKQLALHLDTPHHSTPLIEADRSLLEQAIYNLLENAIKYTESGGEVKIGVAVHKKEIIIAIRDDGIGISPFDQPRIFERFFRVAGRETRKQRGSGLGLAIVKSIAERHGGRVWVDSQLRKGSTFYLSIPLRQGGLIDNSQKA
ncbi:MAG: HAMP domain-containing protein [Chloroflexi bacterium]|nr:HAMP domain-containing protein [Chloroflexota bacterium]